MEGFLVIVEGELDDRLVEEFHDLIVYWAEANGFFVGIFPHDVEDEDDGQEA